VSLSKTGTRAYVAGTATSFTGQDREGRPCARRRCRNERRRIATLMDVDRRLVGSGRSRPCSREDVRLVFFVPSAVAMRAARAWGCQRIRVRGDRSMLSSANQPSFSRRANQTLLSLLPPRPLASAAVPASQSAWPCRGRARQVSGYGSAWDGTESIRVGPVFLAGYSTQDR
jgi:hypothetical protein